MLASDAATLRGFERMRNSSNNQGALLWVPRTHVAALE
jgi:hypothetical protein